jgi:hypothetical protein
MIQNLDVASVHFQHTTFLKASQGSAHGFDRKPEITADVLT